MTLRIISTTEVIFDGDVEMVKLPGEQGQFTVLKNHAALISVLVAGEIIYRTPDGTDGNVTVKGGIADIDNNIVSVCAY